MILVDANLLLYAENTLSPQHRAAQAWWDAQLSGTTGVCLCWPVLTAFVRISTNYRAFRQPLSIRQAVQRVDSWFQQPCVRLVQPTEQHWAIFQHLLQQGQATANLVMDAHIATLAIEHGCILCSTDTDFARFPRVKCRNPLAAPIHPSRNK